MALSRRRFLKALGGAVATVGIAGCGSGSGGSRGIDNSGGGDPGSTGSTGMPGSDGGTEQQPPDGGTQPPPQLTGRIVRPGDSDYDAARGNFNGRFSLRPGAVVFAATTADVANAVLWARANNQPLRPRSGRHSYEAYSLCDSGVVIDVSAMNSIAYDSMTGRARIGAGCDLITIYDGLAKSGVTLATGSCASLGIGGVALGGGIGVLARKFGLTCDQLVSADIVTADGKTVTASASNAPDLFWALRGGGGGNFGVVTSFEFNVQPVGDVAIYNVFWTAADFPAVMRAWQGFAPYADPALFSGLSVDNKNVYSSGLYIGSASDLQNRLAPLLAAGSPMNLKIQTMSYVDAAREFSDDGGPGARPKFKNGSAYVTTALPDAAIAAIQQQLAAGPGPNNTLEFDPMGGAIAAVGASDTAYAHRGAIFDIQFQSYWTDDADEAANRAWIKSARAALAPYTDGSYVNYIDSDVSDLGSYYGANLSRLSTVKRAYDPDGFFAFAQSIVGK
jgi:FAD/FMN-containing dehydrogenase